MVNPGEHHGHPKSSNLLPGNPVAESVLLAKKIIEENFDESITRKFLCEKTGLNRNKLRKEFKKGVGMTTKAYQVKVKIERAKILLSTTNDPVRQIAFAVGYQRPLNFSLEFKRQVGMSPRAWRKSKRK